MPEKAIIYAHHEKDPVAIKDRVALIYVNRHWQPCRLEIADRALVMTREQFETAFGSIADRLPPL